MSGAASLPASGVLLPPLLPLLLPPGFEGELGSGLAARGSEAPGLVGETVSSVSEGEKNSVSAAPVHAQRAESPR